MDYSVCKEIDISKLKIKKQIGQYTYFAENDGLYFKAPYPFPVELMISEGLNKCQVTPMFLKLPFILKGWINLDILLRLIDVMKLALNGVLMLHGSCVDDILVVGFPNSGKTYHTYMMVKQGGTLIAEEYTIIKDCVARAYKPVMRTCFSNRTIKDCGINLNWKEKVQLAANTVRAKVMPFMFEDVIWKEIPASGNASMIRKIYYGSTMLEVTDWRTLAILTENEFPFTANEFIQAYALATNLDIIEIQNKQRGHIKGFVNAIYPPSK